jgi:hypothetical protein
VETKLAALSTYRMAKGLCRKCGEKWHKGHKCADSVQLNVVQEIWDLLEPESPRSQLSDEDTTAEQVFMAISEAVVSGIETPWTLKIKGTIQQIEILILLDSGSSHSFISEAVATYLQGVIVNGKVIRVKVASGQVMNSAAELLQAEWVVQGYIFHSNLKVLALQNFDMILGMEWLERFSPMKIHLARKWLQIPYQGSTVTLQGFVPGSLDCAMIELMELSA